jgi:hypothetical protein
VDEVGLNVSVHGMHNEAVGGWRVGCSVQHYM